MNKSTLILILLSGLTGFSLVWMWQTGFNPVTAVTQFINNPVSVISGLVGLVMQRWEIVATGVTVFSAGFALFVNSIKQVKSTHKDAENLLRGQVLEANQATAKVEGKYEAVKAQVTEQTSRIKLLETEKTELNNVITEQNKTIQRQRNDLSYGQKAEKDWVLSEIKKRTRKP